MSRSHSRIDVVSERKWEHLFSRRVFYPKCPESANRYDVLDLDLYLWLWYDGSVWTLVVEHKREGVKMKVGPDLLRVLQAQSQADVAVIVHVDGDPAQYATAIGQLGLSVVRTFRLTHTIAARGLARDVLALLDQPWVIRVEPDQTITTMV